MKTTSIGLSIVLMCLNLAAQQERRTARMEGDGAGPMAGLHISEDNGTSLRKEI